MRNYKIILFIVIIALLLIGCVRETNNLKNNLDNNITNIIYIESFENISFIKSKIEADSFEFLIENITSDKIEIPPSFMSIIKEKDGKILVAVSTSGIAEIGDTLLKIHSKNFKIEKINYFSRTSINKDFEEWNPYNWKWGGLLGDFNLDGKVGLTDFASFIYYYGMDPWEENVPPEFSRFDIGPALNIVKKDIWSNIYDYKLEDWKVNIIDFSIFTANFGYDITLIPTPEIITLNSNTDISAISTETYRNIAYVFLNTPSLANDVMSILNNHSNFINSIFLSLENNDIFELITNIINMPDSLETSIINLIEKIGNYAQNLKLDNYLDANFKWEINDFDWNGDGIINNDIELHIEATVTYTDNPEPQRKSLGLYTDLILKDYQNIESIEFIGIDKNTLGDAIFDWELLEQFKNQGFADDGYSPTFDTNDYLIIDEGFISMLSFILNNIYIPSKGLFLYNLTTPSATFTDIIASETPEASFMELFYNLTDDYIITKEELINNILGNMLNARDNLFETSVASIQNSILSLKDSINYSLQDSIMDYLYQDHDITSGPMDLFSTWELFYQNITNLAITDINYPMHIGGNVILYPAVFFENPEKFKDLNIYLPEITLEGTMNVESIEIETITINFPNAHFGGLISGIENPLIISTIDFNQQNMQEPQITDYEIEGITRIRPDEFGNPTPELALRFDVNISNPENVKNVEVWKNDVYITDLYFEKDNYYYNEKIFDVSNLNSYENTNYTIKVYDYNDNIVDTKNIYLGALYPENTLEITSPNNFNTYYYGESITLQWNNNLTLFYEGAEINVAKIDETTYMVDWENRIRVADDYDPDTPNFSITDLSYNIPANIFDSSGMYLVELVIYNWSENTSFEYHIIINIL
ncbi:hypothetical protein SAMN02745164_01524 [Marinitoga hydrogenitolerans DSM 16785]|uniref:Uncharacterized protein n=1 Tax=Marinitoga hydrogenitolerans (strain DSM 16785 / JCM 12826 / AT1271) TaxID=1122195 RepID=A0A1M4XVF6_MARH1|nr:hypothetical protein [Marinitoga hydrogenitolerans]SHE97336.1 hypothetical protein SAMN02745164_01524 [Marinitoga hydrogenitolerans DSM 16785]